MAVKVNNGSEIYIVNINGTRANALSCNNSLFYISQNRIVPSVISSSNYNMSTKTWTVTRSNNDSIYVCVFIPSNVTLTSFTFSVTNIWQTGVAYDGVYDWGVSNVNSRNWSGASAGGHELQFSWNSLSGGGQLNTCTITINGLPLIVVA